MFIKCSHGLTRGTILFGYFVSNKFLKRPVLKFDDVSFSLSFENNDIPSLLFFVITIFNYLKTQIC